MGIEKQVNDWYALKELLWDISSEKDVIVKVEMKKVYIEMLVKYEETYKTKFLVNQRPIERFI